MKLYNTLSRQIEEVVPLIDKKITFYSCGPTVYDYTHIGHLRTYVNVDLLKRTLSYFDYNVTHVMNITDVGHLTGDTDEGEDKLEKGAIKTGKSVWDVAKMYTEQFISSIKALNISEPDELPRATDNIEAMIELIKSLQEKGYTYQTKQAIYFDVSKFERYGKLSGQKLEDKKTQARPEVILDHDKKNQADFALWFFLVGRFENHQMHWPFDSAQGKEAGFPGWHIECSAMSMKYLGPTIDIHGGGVDHIAVHHENEIAQSEAATGQPFVRHWFHSEFLLIDGEKMSKSKDNFYTLEEVAKQGFEPIALRYLFLTTHYRQQLNFTWESLEAAQAALNKLKNAVMSMKSAPERPTISEEKLQSVSELSFRFKEALENDLQLPKALAIVWETVKSNNPSSDKLELLLDFDQVLGLGLNEVEGMENELPPEIEKIKTDYELARQGKDFSKSDMLRQQADKLGYRFEDSPTGTTIKKLH